MIRRIFRLTLVEFSKIRRQKFIYLALLIILLTVIGTIFEPKINPSGKVKQPSAARAGQSDDTTWEIAGQRSATAQTGQTNGFEPMVKGCLNGFKIAVLFLLIFGSLMISSETTSGTLRTVLIRPFRRSELFLAKGLTLIIIAVLIAMIIQAVSFGLSGYFYGFRDILDPDFPDYQPYALKGEMFRYAFYSFVMFLLPFISAGFLGLLISTLVENTGVAVALAILLYLPLDYLMLGLFENMAPYLFNNYLEYYWSTFQDITQRILEDSWKFKIIDDFMGGEPASRYASGSAQKLEVLKSVMVPLIYIVFFNVVGLFIFKKKDVLV
ncbi:MAG: ABC transporter permease subunit [Planctomycetota bacterium]